jgi:uncharacterized protein
MASPDDIPDSLDPECALIAGMVEHAIHYLPTQGPIAVFVHHNTLHSLEYLPFEQGVVAGAAKFGCEPWWSEARYRAESRAGRIRREDLLEVLLDDLGENADQLVGSFGTRFALRMAMLEFPLQSYPEVELKWLLAETDMLRRFHPGVPERSRRVLIAQTAGWIRELVSHDDCCRSGEVPSLEQRAVRNLNGELAALDRDLDSGHEEAATLRMLWAVVEEGTRQLPQSLAAVPGDPDACSGRGPASAACRPQGKEKQPPGSDPVPAMGRDREASSRKPVRLRDRIVQATGHDPDLLVHDLLIRFCGAFLDQGFAPARTPGRSAGFAKTFGKVLGGGSWPRPAWLKQAAAALRGLSGPEFDPLRSIADSLRQLEVPVPLQQEFIERTLLALAGWAGMIWQLETNAPWSPRPAPAGSLYEFLAVRLILDRHAAAHVEREPRQARGRSQGVADNAARRALERAFTAFQMAQVRGWQPKQLAGMTIGQWAALVREIEQFPALERRRIFHLAYESRFRRRTLDALSLHAPAAGVGAPGRVAWQVVTCIDDREESFRRHLEETDPECRTFGAAGFFAVVMYYRGVDQAHYRPLCPINVVPRHRVVEEPLFSLRMASRARSLRRRWLGLATRGLHVSSRTILGGALSGLAGTLATFPLLGRVLAPGLTARVRQSAAGLVRPVATELRLARELDDATDGTELTGFTTEEMAGIVVRLLQDIGLVRDLAPVVVVLGHGSSSLNNPHESAYNCGACSGGKGGPNARALAWMANQLRVRALVRERGIDIADEVHFVGGIHDTCTDTVQYFDLDAIPPWHRELWLGIQATVEEACQRNAHERSRRFESVPLDATPTEALEAVRQRAEDLSQVRPEYNHATTAICLVGRREWSRGLFLDRRAFLVSYDPRIDDDRHSILTRILGAVIPVCGGISLEYLFSALDPEGYGCGSKLPHNIASLAGVMTGAASDLRPGLSQQMTEIHEPMRLLVVVEADHVALEKVVQSNRVTEQLVMNQWVQLAAIDPATGAIQLLRPKGFERWIPEVRDLPRSDGSLAWYSSQRGHLEFARIQPAPAAGFRPQEGGR